jgi:hypothetical protein
MELIDTKINTFDDQNHYLFLPLKFIDSLLYFKKKKTKIKELKF